MRAALLLIALPIWAADDVDTIIRRAIDVERENGLRAQQYTYTEETERYSFEKNGKARMTATETHEVIFVEGVKYKKLVARNGRPLGAREQAKVEKDMQLTAEERRRHQRPTAPGGVVTIGGLFGQQSFDLGSLSELLTLYDNRVVGEEQVRGHKAWVIESTPRQGYVPRSRHEDEVLVFGKKFWVAKAEGALVRGVYTMAATDTGIRPGSTLTFEFEKVDAETWEPVRLTLNFSRTKEKVFRPTVRTVYRMSKFQRFDVQSTITVGEEK